MIAEEIDFEEAERLGRKVLGMIDRLIEAERFTPNLAPVVRWHFEIDGSRYSVVLDRAPL